MSSSDLVARLRSERYTPPALWLQFVQVYLENDGRRRYVFFEGADDPSYYLPLLRAVAPGTLLNCLVCDGKARVLTLLQRIEASHPQAMDRVAFFVDSDIDQLAGEPVVTHPRLYTTDGYSFENDLAGLSNWKVLWEEVLGLRAADSRRDMCELFARIAMSNFERRMRAFMAMVIAMRRSAFRPSLESISIRRILRLQATGGVVWALHPASELAPYGRIPGWRDLLCVARSLRAVESRKYVRGKYALAFTCMLLDRIRRVLLPTNNVSMTTASPGADFNNRYLILTLSARCEYPSSLRDFAERTLG